MKIKEILLFLNFFVSKLKFEVGELVLNSMNIPATFLHHFTV